MEHHILDKTTKKLEFIFQAIFIAIAVGLLIQWLFQDYIQLSDTTAKILDWGIWAFLFLEIITLVIVAKNKWEYLTRNWINVVIMLIFFPLFWFHTTAIIFLRFVRLFILLRFFAPSFKVMKEVLTFNGIGITLLLVFILATLSGILMAEIDPAIHSIGDGIWWAWETITTVGYGDETPITTHGRTLAVLVMILGAMLFSVITANLSAYFVSKSRLNKDMQKSQHEKKQILNAVLTMQKQLEEIQKKLTTTRDH